MHVSSIPPKHLNENIHRMKKFHLNIFTVWNWAHCSGRYFNVLFLRLRLHLDSNQLMGKYIDCGNKLNFHFTFLFFLLKCIGQPYHHILMAKHFAVMAFLLKIDWSQVKHLLTSTFGTNTTTNIIYLGQHPNDFRYSMW